MRRLIMTSALLFACAGQGQPPLSPGKQPAPKSLVPPGQAARVDSTFRLLAERYSGADYPRLESELGIRRAQDEPLGFDPTRVLYYDRIFRDLKLTAAEHAVFARQGLVSVDHAQRYSMGSAYFAIYSRDLPVLVTTDSILHALHRTYDKTLETLESQLFVVTLRGALDLAHEELARVAPGLPSAVQTSASDVDVYLTAARALLGAAPRSKLDNDVKVGELLKNVDQLLLQGPDHPTEIYGGRRPVDYSQFKPRGHYTHTPALSRYFRAMIWLGRADLGFVLQRPDAATTLKIDPVREARSAALLTLILQSSGAAVALQRMAAIVDFMVGRADSLSIDQMGQWLARHGVRDGAGLVDDGIVKRMAAELSGQSQQQIRSQVVVAPRGGDTVAPPEILQVFGQRFGLDSFVLSRTVFDSIVFEGAKPERMVPSGLDVMAAFGNDEAVRLLRPELERWHYSANLLAARKTIDQTPPSAFSADLYHGWLGVLRTLDDVPRSGAFPRVMRNTPWQRKQLQAQLGSWAELRHDTILYAKQSYTAHPECGYPAGFVEPYPEFFDQLQRLTLRAAGLLAAADVDASGAPYARSFRDRQVKFFLGFADVMQKLGSLARKELAAQPFTSDEQSFLKKTIDARGAGSGPPRYDGWYAKLIYGGEPEGWLPTIADVHTDPQSGNVLEVGVGDVEFMVVAIDNQADRAAYVGPVYSYYELTHPASDRLTDQQWEELLQLDSPPPRPAFSKVFRAPRVARSLGPRDQP